jgi:hypothetical protein
MAEIPEQHAPTSESYWSESVMTLDRIKALEARGLIGPQALLEWKLCDGLAFPSEDDKETVVFASFFERGFGIPAGDFFRGVLHYYKIEWVHLNPNSIFDIAFFIHFCKAYLGVPPHFNLWRYLYQLKKISTANDKNKVIGGAGFSLGPNRGDDYFDLQLNTTNKGWTREWFTVANQLPSLPPHSGYVLVPDPIWTKQITATEQLQVDHLLKRIADLKTRGLTAVAVCINFARRLTQPIKLRVHPAYEYEGPEDLTREAKRKVTRDEAIARVSEFFGGEVKNHKCPKAFSLLNHEEPVSYYSLSRLVFELLFCIVTNTDLPLQGLEAKFWCPAPLPGDTSQQPKLRPQVGGDCHEEMTGFESDSTFG